MKNAELEIALLGFLVNGAKHGYELHKEISDPEGIGGVWHVKIGKMYSMLKKLEKQGLIKAISGQDGNRPPKTTYYLTEQGKNTFYDWMITPIQHGRDLRILFLLKIYLMRGDDLNFKKNIILKQEAECEKWKEHYRFGSQERFKENSFLWFVKKYRSSQIEGFINWLNWCGERIEEAK
ncbi:MAG: PadR family transcriptional regulator [Promethearchaeota archaeon]